MNALVAEMNASCDREDFDVAWHLTDLRSGFSADRNGDVPWPSASTRKVAIMMAAFRENHEGRLSLTARTSPDPRYLDDVSVSEGTGCLQYFRPGYELTILDYLTLMIVLSDNVSRSLLIDALTLETINRYSHDIGMVHTLQGDNNPDTIRDWDAPDYVKNVTTANDQGLLLRMIVAGAQDEGEASKLGVTSEHCRQAVGIMKAQQLNLAIPYLLPPTARVAHKTGGGRRTFTEYGTVYHGASDIGIVYEKLEPRFVLAVYCDNVPVATPDGRAGQGAAQTLMARLGRMCWDGLVENAGAAGDA